MNEKEEKEEKEENEEEEKEEDEQEGGRREQVEFDSQQSFIVMVVISKKQVKLSKD